MEMPEIVNGEKYNLKWNRRHNIIATNVLEHLSEEELVDVTLTCEGQFIKAHKLILSASSQYFKELFQRHRGQNPIIIMTNIKFEYLKYIIDYIYKGEIRLLSSEIQGILQLANELKIKGLYGILNKSFQHLADMNNDQKPTPKNKKINNKDEESHGKLNIEPKNPVPTMSTSINIIIDSEEQTRLKSRGMNADKKGEGDYTVKPKRKKRKIIQNKTNPIEPELDISQAFRAIFPKPANSMDISNPTVIPEAEMTPVTVQSDPLLDPLLHSDSSTQTVPNSIESPGVSSQVIESSNISTPIVTKTEEPSQTYLEATESNMKDKINTVEGSKHTDAPKSTSVKLISAFMLFTDEYRPIISLEYPDESVKQISLRLSSMWKNLPNKKKDSYYEEASRENEKRKQKMKKLTTSTIKSVHS